MGTIREDIRTLCAAAFVMYERGHTVQRAAQRVLDWLGEGEGESPQEHYERARAESAQGLAPFDEDTWHRMIREAGG